MRVLQSVTPTSVKPTFRPAEKTRLWSPPEPTAAAASLTSAVSLKNEQDEHFYDSSAHHLIHHWDNCVCVSCSVLLLSGDAICLLGGWSVDSGCQHHRPLLPLLPVWSEHTLLFPPLLQTEYLNIWSMKGCVCAVCDPYRCSQLTCPLGMSVVSVSSPGRCCPNQTCGRAHKQEHFYMNSKAFCLFSLTQQYWFMMMIHRPLSQGCNWNMIIFFFSECSCEKIASPKCGLVRLGD